GAATEKEDKWSQTPLSLTAENGHEGIVKMLLERGAVTETQNQNGRTPLSLAAENGYEGIVKMLIERGAATGTKAKSDRRPVMQRMGMRLLTCCFTYHK
ncbi:hypothetical protein AKAW_11057, partial [Aspergillus luchuensis IFO 4308]